MVEKILQLCKAKGIAISTLEKDLGFSNKAIYRWDKHSPSVEKVEAVSSYLGVSVDYLLSGEAEEKQSVEGKKYYFDDATAEAAQKMFNNKELRMAFDALSSVPAEELKKYYAVIKAMKDNERERDNNEVD